MTNRARDFRNRAQASMPGAVVIERGRSFIRHQHPTDPSKFIWDGLSNDSPIHIAGTQTEIDTAWVNGNNAPYRKQMVLADYNAFLGLDDLINFDAGQIIKYVHPGTGESISFQPQQLQWTNDLNQIQPISDVLNVPASITDDVALWENGYGTGLSFQIQTQSLRLQKKLVINSLSDLGAPSQAIIDGGNPVNRLQFIFQKSAGIEIWIDGVLWDEKANNPRTTTGTVEFRSGGQTLWYFKPAWAVDNLKNVITPEFRFRAQAQNLFVEIRTPWAWLQSASYPVEIDPTVDVNVAAGGDDGYWRTVAASFNSTGNYVFIGAAVVAGWSYHAWYRFTGVTCSGTISTADITVVADSVTGTLSSVATTVYAEDANSPSAPTSQSDADGRTTTTAGVNWNPSAWTGGTSYTSPELKTVIQELVDTYTISSSAVQILHKDNSSASTNNNIVVRSYDFNTSYAEALHIEYSSGANLTVANASVTTQADAPSLTQVHNITVNDGAVTTQADVFNLTQVHNLLVDNSFVTTQVDAIVVTSGAATLVVANASVTPQVDTFNLTQVHNLLVNDASVTPQVDAPVIFQAHVLSVNGTSVTLQVDAITSMTQVHNLNVGDTFVVTQADVLSLSQVHNLLVNGSYVVPTVDATVISVISQAAVIYWHLYHRDKNMDLEDRDLGLDLYDRDSNWDLKDI